MRKAAGLEGYRFHDLRWTFITMCAENDVPIEVTISMVGHSNPAMTRHYTAIRTRAQQRAVATLEQANRLVYSSLVDVEQLRPAGNETNS
jgi:integrase